MGNSLITERSLQTGIIVTLMFGDSNMFLFNILTFVFWVFWKRQTLLKINPDISLFLSFRGAPKYCHGLQLFSDAHVGP